MPEKASTTVDIKYIHEETTHNLSSPEIIVPEVIKLVNPRTVIDIGCGIGTFLNIFKKNGIEDYIGVDGSWVKDERLLIEKDHFYTADLEKEFNIGRSFDLVVCLEVVEHLEADSSETIIQSLINHGKIILFSAAIANQGGQNHINEQNFDYWQQKFKVHNYSFYDTFRPLLWNNKKVQWWYKQNMFLVVHDSVDLSPAIKATRLADNASTYVHPETLEFYHRLYDAELNKNSQLSAQLKEIIWGQKKMSFYIKGLLKRIVRAFK